MLGARNTYDKRSISGQLLTVAGFFSANETFLALTQEALENMLSAGSASVCVCVCVCVCNLTPVSRRSG